MSFLRGAGFPHPFYISRILLYGLRFQKWREVIKVADFEIRVYRGV